MALTLLVLLENKKLIQFLDKKRTQGAISEFCSAQNIEWKFIPERAPHFGGLWEAAVKSMKFHLKRVIANTKFTFEEFTTILTQVCLNSRPLTPMSCDSDAVEAPDREVGGIAARYVSFISCSPATSSRASVSVRRSALLAEVVS